MLIFGTIFLILFVGIGLIFFKRKPKVNPSETPNKMNSS